MTSNSREKEAYVWIWLPGETQPQVAGVVTKWRQGQYAFNYSRSYLDNPLAIPIYSPELPLIKGRILPTHNLNMASSLRDAAPDVWGRRVILNRLTGTKVENDQANGLDEIDYFLESGSDRIGALDFQSSATHYVARQNANASMEELLCAAQMVDEGRTLTKGLDEALRHGTSLGGARPKATIEDDNRKYIAKFSSSTDIHNVVKYEFVSMRLAKRAGLNVAPVSLVSSLNKDVLLVERFDRVRTEKGWIRKAMVSALTLFELDEMMARYASYETFTQQIRERFTDPEQTLHELFGRLVFNILCGNTDDHARNHGAFWDGQAMTLTPAYDLCPQPRKGQEASQAMLILGNNNLSQLSLCLKAAANFQLSESQAREIIDAQIDSIVNNMKAVADEAGLTPVDRARIVTDAFFNPFAFEGYSGRPKLIA